LGLQLPSELTEPLGWIGLIWPEADEDLLYEAGQSWIQAAQKIQAAAEASDRAASDIWTADAGDSTDAFREWWTRDDGPSQRLSDDARAALLIGAALVAFAAVTLALKIAFIAQLVALLIEVAQAIATAFATFGATTAEIPGFIAITRLVCRELIRQAVEHVQTIIADIFKQAKNLLRLAKDLKGGAADLARRIATGTRGGEALFGAAWRGDGTLRLTAGESEAVGRLFAGAKGAEPGLTAAMKDVTAGLDGAHLEGLDFRLKTPESLLRKVATAVEQHGDLGRALTESKDTVRYTVSSTPSTYTGDVRAVVSDLQGRGYEPVKWKNTWGNDGYQGINSFWRDPASGTRFEVQFHTPESFDLKMSTHDLYETARVPGVDPQVAREADAQANALLASATPPPGAVDLGPPG